MFKGGYLSYWGVRWVHIFDELTRKLTWRTPSKKFFLFSWAKLPSVGPLPLIAAVCATAGLCSAPPALISAKPQLLWLWEPLEVRMLSITSKTSGKEVLVYSNTNDSKPACWTRCCSACCSCCSNTSSCSPTAPELFKRAAAAPSTCSNLNNVACRYRSSKRTICTRI